MPPYGDELPKSGTAPSYRRNAGATVPFPHSDRISPKEGRNRSSRNQPGAPLYAKGAAPEGGPALRAFGRPYSYMAPTKRMTTAEASARVAPPCGSRRPEPSAWPLSTPSATAHDKASAA